MTGLQEDGLGRAAVRQGAEDFVVKGSVSEVRLAETLLYAVERARRAGVAGLRDPLTGLAGPALLTERITEALGRAEREKRSVAALVLGIGGFAGVDARFGPGAGEQLLSDLAERLCQVLPPATVVGRTGVDEFAAVLEGIVRPSNAERAGQRVLGVLAPDFKLGADALRVEGAVGVALGRRVADAPELVERARAAMLEQRRVGGQGVRLA